MKVTNFGLVIPQWACGRYIIPQWSQHPQKDPLQYPVKRNTKVCLPIACIPGTQPFVPQETEALSCHKGLSTVYLSRIKILLNEQRWHRKTEDQTTYIMFNYHNLWKVANIQVLRWSGIPQEQMACSAMGLLTKWISTNDEGIKH